MTAAERQTIKDQERAYSIVRFYQRASIRRRTIQTGLTLAEAQAHCRDPKTSGDDKRRGPWFDGYERT